MDGVLNINKPAGMTSHDVVMQVRRLLKEKRVGHTGTLDPSATGVLVLCIGKATRVAQHLEAGEKQYRAVMRLGVITDTLDADGKVLETRPHVPPEPSLVVQVLKQYLGTITQTPPAYSAVKIQGVPSYKLAREGKAVSLKQRLVSIYALELISYDHPFVKIDVRCSKGVYIRTLCADIGEALGCGAHVSSLVRTGSGRFGLGDAITLEQLAMLSDNNQYEQMLVPIERALEELPPVFINGNDVQKILHGNRIMISGHTGRQELLVRVHAADGRLLALARETNGEIRPETVFC